MVEKGFVKILALTAVAVILVILGLKFIKIPASQEKSSPRFETPQNQSVIASPEPSPIMLKSPASTKYKDFAIGFEFEYPTAGFAVIEDSEEEFSKRAQTQFRKNFTNYVGFEPPTVIRAVVLRRLGDPSKIFDLAPFTLWVFENPDELDIDRWYKKYWYYPFTWGDFTQNSQKAEWPKNIATISGQTAKYSVLSYQEGKPKFLILPWRGKMFLFRVTEKGGEGDAVMDSFSLP